MKAEAISGKGLQVSMDGMLRLTPVAGVPDYWHLENQREFRRWFSPFLPKMEYNSENNTVLASMVEGGREKLCESVEAEISGYPINELVALQETIDKWKADIEAADMNATTRQLVESFALPDPQKNPEMYRVYGPRNSPRLAILWGMEQDEGSSIKAMEMDVAEAFKISADKFKRTESRSSFPVGRVVAGVAFLALLFLCIKGCGGDETEIQQPGVVQQQPGVVQQQPGVVQQQPGVVQQQPGVVQQQPGTVQPGSQGPQVQSAPAAKKYGEVAVSPNFPFSFTNTAQETLADGSVQVSLSMRVTKGIGPVKAARVQNVPVGPGGTVTIVIKPGVTKEIPVVVDMADGRQYSTYVPVSL